MEILGASLSSLYYIVCFLLVVYGLYRVWLLVRHVRALRQLPPTPPRRSTTSIGSAS
jgi:hypothetical protein